MRRAHRTIWALPAAGEGLFCASSGLGANAPRKQAHGVAVGSWWCVWGGSIGGRCALVLSLAKAEFDVP